jgi:acetyltransferase-like isoleucine patch superfamily enzyme
MANEADADYMGVMLTPADLAQITIEEGAFIDPSCSVHNAEGLVLRRGAFVGPHGVIDAYGGVEIGEAVRISYRCLLISNTHHISPSVWRRSIEGDRRLPVVIERGCWIGAGVTIYPGVTVREGCVINAGAVLHRSTEPNGLYCAPAAVRVKDLPTWMDEPEPAGLATLHSLLDPGEREVEPFG